jgi:multidrug efflux pump subunit AcrA (membrane-fusion protein)
LDCLYNTRAISRNNVISAVDVTASEQTAELKAPALAFNPQSGDSGLWNSLSEARNASEFCHAWLSIQCGLVSGTLAGLLLLDDGDGHFSSVAAWPDSRRDLGYLADAAQQALTRRTTFVSHPAPQGSSPTAIHIGQPVEIAGRLKGVVVIDIRRANGDLSGVIHQLRWGIGWLEVLLGRQQIEQESAKLARTDFALKVLNEANEHASFRASTHSVVNELAARLHCSRVSIGFWKDSTVRLAAISHSAVFNERTHIVSAIENAMEEAADQNASVVVPASRKTERRIALTHEDFAKQVGASAVASIVMTNGVKCIGVILLERDRGDAFDDNTIELLEGVAALVGPGLETKSESNKLITGRAVHAAGSTLRTLIGPGRPAFKLAAIAIAAVLVYLIFAEGDFRISAKAAVEGSVQRAAVAPFDGYISRAPVRAGDIVESGQILAALDDRELRLEAARWKSEYDQQSLKYSDAMAKRDRSAALVLSASLEQTQVQLSLVEDKIARATIVSPFHGVIVSGDLSQVLGSPIEKGKVLFEIAPLDSFRVILQVDERDVVYLEQGQQGTLLLTGLSAKSLPFTIKKITPVATASEGRNHFRVEADVQATGSQLRPGMEGIGKVDIDRRALITIWTRSLLDWVRITVWKWSP